MGRKHSQKENGDVLTAAQTQGWQVGWTKDHIQLIPPDKDKPMVVTSATPGDVRARQNFISQMRRSGLIWPPPPPAKKNGTTTTVATEGDIIFTPIEGLDLSVRTYNVLRREGILTVGSIISHSAADLLNLRGFNERCLGEIKVKLFDFGLELQPDPVKEEEMTAPVLEEKTAEVEWVPIPDPDLVPGYHISREGEVRSPKGKILSPNLQGFQVWMSLRSSTSSSGMLSRRLDKLMLETFYGPAPEGTSPVHKNGDTLDCRLENLEWGIPTPSPRRRKTSAEGIRKRMKIDKRRRSHKPVESPLPAPNPRSQAKTPTAQEEDSDLKIERTLSLSGVELRVNDSTGEVLVTANSLALTLDKTQTAALVRLVGLL